jgi:hypothetical protein
MHPSKVTCVEIHTTGWCQQACLPPKASFRQGAKWRRRGRRNQVQACRQSNIHTYIHVYTAFLYVCGVHASTNNPLYFIRSGVFERSPGKLVVHTYTCTHVRIDKTLHRYLRACIHHTYIHTCMHACMRPSYIHTYIHTHIHTYLHMHNRYSKQSLRTHFAHTHKDA